MNAGRELDVLIGEKVFGRTMTCPVCSEVHSGEPWYSTDIAAAWQVVEHMRKSGYYVSVVLAGGGVDVEVGKGGPPINIWQCETAPLAICLAARAALTED